MLNKYDLINEYSRFFWKFANEYSGKSPSMKEYTLHYLNEYTRLIGTWEYGQKSCKFLAKVDPSVKKKTPSLTKLRHFFYKERIY